MDFQICNYWAKNIYSSSKKIRRKFFHHSRVKLIFKTIIFTHMICNSEGHNFSLLECECGINNLTYAETIAAFAQCEEANIPLLICSCMQFFLLNNYILTIGLFYYFHMILSTMACNFTFQFSKCIQVIRLLIYIICNVRKLLPGWQYQTSSIIFQCSPPMERVDHGAII